METTGHTWDEIRALAIERDGSRCTVGWLLGGDCHETLDAHHLIPREEGGPDTLGNLITACHRHHPMVEAIRREVLRRRGWKRCPHGPGVHRYAGAREACERNLNRHLIAA